MTYSHNCHPLLLPSGRLDFHPFDKISVPICYVRVGLAQNPQCTLLSPLLWLLQVMRDGHSTALVTTVCETGGKQDAEGYK